MTTNLMTFLNAPANMHAREAILMHRLFLDLKVAAARRGYYLNTYFDDIDHDGFDVIFDDQDYVKKIQVKSVGKGTGANAWGIHKRILRPSHGSLETLGFEGSSEGEGSEGGVIVIEFEDDGNTLKATYRYTDVFILLAFEHELLKRTHGNSIKAVDDCLKDWRKGSGKELLHLPKAAFLKAKNAETLLSLIGLHGPVQSSWKYDAVQVVNHLGGDRKINLASSLDALRKNVWIKISELVDEEKLTGSI
jgi:hypothetical protein